MYFSNCFYSALEAKCNKVFSHWEYKIYRIYYIQYFIGGDTVISIATRLRAGRSGFVSGSGKRFFSSKAHTGSGTHPASYSVGSFPGLMRPWRDVDHSSPSSGGVKN
jgi:hypothetical protein